jgi:hypothetical protein
MKVTPEVMNGVLLHHWFNLVEIPACIQKKKTYVRGIKRKRSATFPGILHSSRTPCMKSCSDRYYSDLLQNLTAKQPDYQTRGTKPAAQKETPS